MTGKLLTKNKIKGEKIVTYTKIQNILQINTTNNNINLYKYITQKFYQ